MWITIFALTFATAIIFSVASYMLHTKYLNCFNLIKASWASTHRGVAVCFIVLLTASCGRAETVEWML